MQSRCEASNTTPMTQLDVVVRPVLQSQTYPYRFTGQLNSIQHIIILEMRLIGEERTIIIQFSQNKEWNDDDILRATYS